MLARKETTFAPDEFAARALAKLEIRTLRGELHGLEPLVFCVREGGANFEAYASAYAVTLAAHIGDEALLDAFFDLAHLNRAVEQRDVELCGLLLRGYADVMASRGMSAALLEIAWRCVADNIVDPYFTVQLTFAKYGPLHRLNAARQQITRYESDAGDALARAAGALFDAIAGIRRRRVGEAARAARTAASCYRSAGCSLLEARAFELAGEIKKAHAIYLRCGASADAARTAAGSTRKSRRASYAIALTTREQQVLDLLGAGHKNKRIADELKISERTVHHHVEAIFSKLGVRHRSQITPEFIADVREYYS